MIRSLFSALLFALALSCGSAHALDPSKSFWSYSVLDIGYDLQMPYAGVDVLRDRDGYLWYATQDGLVRLIDDQVRTYELHNTPGLISNQIIRLAEDKNGTLYALSSRGIAVEQGDTFAGTNFRTEIDEVLRDIAIIDETVWVATNSGLFQLVDEQLVPIDTSLPISIVRSINGELWIGGIGFVGHWNEQRLEFVTFKEPQKNSQVTDIVKFRDQLWVATDRGPFILDEAGLTPAPIAELFNVSLSTLAPDRDGNLWIGGPEILGRLYPNGQLEWPELGGAAFGFRPSIARLYEDDEGIMWHVSTFHGLKLQFDGLSRRVSSTEGLNDIDVKAVLASERGEVLVGTGDGLSSIRNEVPTTLVEGDRLPGAEVVDLLSHQGLWLATSNGVAYFKNYDYSLAPTTFLTGRMVYSLAITDHGTIWAGTEDGAYVISGNAGTRVMNAPRVAIKTLLAADGGAVWVGTDRGLFFAENGNLQLQGTESLLATASISALARLDEKHIVAVSRDLGVFVFDGMQWTHASMHLGLPNVGATFAAMDDRSQLWLAGSRGVLSVNASDLTSINSDHASFRYVLDPNFKVRGSEGVNCCQGVGGNNGAIVDGVITLATDDGVISFPTEATSRWHEPPEVSIQGAWAGDRPLPLEAAINLLPEENEVALKFAAKTFVTKDHVNFRFRLMGRTDKWANAGHVNMARYADLAPGEYEFQVQASVRDFEWGPMQSLSISHAAEFWETPAFKLFAAVVSIMLLAAVIGQRFRVLARRNEVIEVIVKERTSALSDSNERLESSLADLRKAQDLVTSLSRRAGQADIASEVMHNLGNVLNSVNVSTEVLAEQIEHVSGKSMLRLAQLLQTRQKALETDIPHDVTDATIVNYLEKLARQFDDKKGRAKNEIGQIRENIRHIGNVVQSQQRIAEGGGHLEFCDAGELLAEALRLNSGAMTRHQISYSITTDPALKFLTDRHQVLQILVNLIKNAKEAMSDTNPEERQLELTAIRIEGGMLELGVADTGSGMNQETLAKIFEQGFTTKSTGSGIGLHSAANIANKLGGQLRVSSHGPGLGTRFALILPIGEIAQQQTQDTSELEIA